MITILQFAAAKTEPSDLLRLARIRHIVEYLRDVHDHSEKFEHCHETLCAAAREQSGLDREMIERFARSHGRLREPGEDAKI